MLRGLSARHLVASFAQLQDHAVSISLVFLHAIADMRTEGHDFTCAKKSRRKNCAKVRAQSMLRACTMCATPETHSTTLADIPHVTRLRWLSHVAVSCIIAPLLHELSHEWRMTKLSRQRQRRLMVRNPVDATGFLAPCCEQTRGGLRTPQPINSEFFVQHLSHSGIATLQTLRFGTWTPPNMLKTPFTSGGIYLDVCLNSKMSRFVAFWTAMFVFFRKILPGVQPIHWRIFIRAYLLGRKHA